jgi:hypothetical protein
LVALGITSYNPPRKCLTEGAAEVLRSVAGQRIHRFQHDD